MRVQLLAMATLVGIGGVVSNSHAAPNKEEYELRERCGKRATEYFRIEYGDGVSYTGLSRAESTFINHYSMSQNRCFILLTTRHFFDRIGNDTPPPSVWITILDVNESRVFGLFNQSTAKSIPSVCEVADRICHSKGEWDALIKPYM